jgi:hypothetical protein
VSASTSELGAAAAALEEIDIDAPIMARHSFGVVGFPVSTNRHPVREQRISSYALPVGGLECDEPTYVAARC